MNRRDVLTTLATLPAAMHSAWAQATSRILVGFPPGGTTDGVARFYAEQMSRTLGRTMLVDNRPGAGGAIAAVALKKAVPDGTTLMLAAIVNISVYPSVANPPTYDPMKDLVPVAMVGQYDLALAVADGSGVKNLADYVKWIRTSPDRANFGSPGNGSLPHLFGVQLGQALQTPLTHVPFQGAAPSIVNLLGGQLGAVIQPVSDLLAQHESGKLHILATTGSKRNARLSEVPTFTELGYPALQGGGWIGFFAPANTPSDTVQSIWRATQEAAAVPAVADRMQALGFDMVPMSTQDFAALIQRDAARWAAVIKAGGGMALLG
jgi:tripartite-type tricarboxylate transporter receptor subunit TctC